MECDATFQKIKLLLTSELILQLPNFDQDNILSTDASSYAIRSVLEQIVDGKLKPIAYFSRKLSTTECNYSNYEKEALEVFASFKHFQKYLIIRKFEVFTDNSAVASILSAKEPTGRIIRCIIYLLSFVYYNL